MDLRTTRKSIYQIVWLLMTCAALHDNVVSAQFSGLQEQAIIVGYHGNLSSIRTLQNATTISLACVAFGLPSPQITWQSHDPINTNYTVNITEFKTQIETNGTEFSYTISVLEVCNVSSSTQLSSYTCIADNGIVSDTPIGEFNRTFLAFTDSVTMETATIGTVTMTTSDEITNPVTMTTNTISSPTVMMSLVSMTTVIIVVAVIVCVVILSAGVVLVAVLGLRRKQKVLKQRSNSENERVYYNSLYGNQTEEQQTTRRSTEDSLYTCEAYSVVPVHVRPADHEYAYIAPPVALHRSTPPAAGNTASAAGADSNDISLYPCAAYNPVAINEMQHSYEDTII